MSEPLSERLRSRIDPDRALCCEAADLIDALVEALESAQTDVRRYRRLQVLGAAPYGSIELNNATVLRFTNLDAYIDADLATIPNRGDVRDNIDAVLARAKGASGS